MLIFGWCRSVLIDHLLTLMAYSLTIMVGIVIFAYYEAEGCDPLRTGSINSSNQVMNKLMHKCLIYLLLCCLKWSSTCITTQSNDVSLPTWQLLPYFVVTALNVPALPGLFVAVLFAGALRWRYQRILNEWRFCHLYSVCALNYKKPPLIDNLLDIICSSVSSHLTSMAAILWKDVIEPFTPKKMSESKRALINKLLGDIFLLPDRFKGWRL